LGVGYLLLDQLGHLQVGLLTSLELALVVKEHSDWRCLFFGMKLVLRHSTLKSIATIFKVAKLSLSDILVMPRDERSSISSTV